MDLIIDAFLTELFSKFDQNGDSRISLSEAKNIFRGLNQRSGLLLTNADAEHFISSLAKNGDGNVDINEFKSGINRLIKNQ